MSGPGVCLQSAGGAAQPAIALVEFTRPDESAREVHERRRDDRLRAPAMLLGECYRLSAPPPRGCEGLDLRCEGELSQACHFEVRTSDPPRKIGALLQVPLAVLVSQRPRFDDPEIHERHRAQVAVERDVLVRLPGYRRGKEPDLLDYPREVAALARQRQFQCRGRHFEAVLAVRRRRCDRGFRHCQVGGSLVQASPSKIAGRAREREIRALSHGTRREGPQQRLDGLSLSVKRQAERVVGEQPRRVGPVIRRLGMTDGVDGLAVLG